jgi:hypothetical protein
MGHSGARGKMIHEKNRSPKSRAKLPLTTVMLFALLRTQLDLCDLCLRHEKLQNLGGLRIDSHRLCVLPGDWISQDLFQ